jgi:hypothetical protein
MARMRREKIKAAIEKRRSLKISQGHSRQKTLLKDREKQEKLNSAGIWASNMKRRATDKVVAFELKMNEVFKSASVKMAAYESKTVSPVQDMMAAARVAGRTMYATGTPVHTADIEKDISVQVQPNPPVDVSPPESKSSFKTHIVTPSVSPIVKKALLTMDMFTPYVDKGLDAWKKQYNVSDAEFADPDEWCTDTSGNAMKTPYVYKLVDDYKKSLADSKFSVDDVSLDARSERAARRSEVIRQVKEKEIAEFKTSLSSKSFNRPRRLSPTVIS